MIEFYDVSKWQAPETVRGLVDKNNDKVLAVKVSEGASIRDSRASYHVLAVKGQVETFIFYHFMRCDKNALNIRAEVSNFITAARLVGEKTGIKKCIFALDFERSDNVHKFSDYANPLHRAALADAIRLLTERNGVAPYVYACESEYKGLLANGVNIPWAWVAKYSNSAPCEPWGIWQYTNTYGKIDRNRYRGDLTKLKQKEVDICR